MRARRFAQIDVFSSEPQRGNPVAVVLDAEGLDGEAMQRFARWTNLSETTFLLAPTVPEADYRVRIFTPNEEMPFAGHPTLGSAHAWLTTAAAAAGDGGATALDRVVQECGAGLVEVRRTDGGLAFAAPPLLRAGPVEEPLIAEVARSLGIARDAIVDAQWADNGPGWIAILLGSADEVLALRPGPIDRKIGVAGPHPPGTSEAIEVRAFFPVDGRTTEDPVTGSLNASLAGWLLAAGRLHAPYTARQGTLLQRAGRVHITQDAAGTIWVAGATTTVIEGTATL